MPRIETFLPACTDYEVLECKSGVRVSGKASYTPIVEKKDDKTWVVSGMGSRGLLYHALMAEDLVGSLNA